MGNILVSPSLLSADFGNLNKDIDLINRCADLFHLDIMDGLFVPNISYGTPVIKAITKRATLPVEAHLMIVEPQKCFADLKNMGVASICVHYEACTHIDRILHQIKELSLTAGVAINPGTSELLLSDTVRVADYILVMSVNPGFGGQHYIPYSTQKIARLKKIINENNPLCKIEVDGGVSLDNIKEIADAGADIVVAGNAVFAAQDPEQVIRQLKSY